jgi:hypothetical protein
LFVFQILGLIFPQFPTVLSLHAISISCFYTINLLKLLPFLCGAFALCLCFDLMFDILKQWDAASCSWSLIFVICYCDLALLHFEMGKIKCFSILFLLPLWSNCVVTISIKYIWQNHLMHWFLFPENLANLFGVHLHFFFL